MNRSGLRPGELAIVLVAVAGAAAAGTAAPKLGGPAVAAAAVAILGAALLVWRFEREAPVLALLVLVPLFPVVTIGPLATALGGHGDSLRAATIVGVLAVTLVLVYRGAVPKPPPGLRPVVAGLLLLALVGAAASFANVTTEQQLPSLLGHLAGQPLVYAGLLILICSQLGNSRAAKERMLIAFSIGVWAQAGVVGWELLSGAAFDASRGFNRAQGTLGANFVSAYAMMAFFVGMAELRFGSPTRRMHLVGLLTMLAALLIVVGVVARGGVIGLLLGLGYLVLTDAGIRRRVRIAAAVAAVLLAGSLLTPASSLWTDRLSTSAVQRFDRPATWVSGVRMGIDNPLTGLGGEAEVFNAVEHQARYRYTPFGPTGVLPHDSWVLALAQGGFAYMLVLGATTLLAIGAAHRRPNRGGEGRCYVAGLIGIAGVAVINNVFTHPELMLVVILLLGLATARGRAQGCAGRPDGAGRSSTLAPAGPEPAAPR